MVFVINLERNGIRRANMAQKLSFENLEFFRGIDGNEIDEQYVIETNKNVSNRTNGLIGSLSKGEIGCALSHLELYKHIISNGIQLCLILEDDVIISVEGIDYINNIFRNGLPAEVELLLVGFSLDAIKYDSTSINNVWSTKYLFNKKIGIPVTRLFGSYGYFITLNSAKKLLEYGYPLRMQSDILLNNSSNADIMMYALKSPIVFPDADNDLSSIGNRDNIEWEFKEKLEKSKISNLKALVPAGIRSRIGLHLLKINNYRIYLRIFSRKPYKHHINDF